MRVCGVQAEAEPWNDIKYIRGLGRASVCRGVHIAEAAGDAAELLAVQRN